ncbi:hypothetical protein FJZ40_03655 [Candidatus Shapirobacteria bacterium]|nr:hypothetical protein [Candidatus Shapirobacteria bacterium]
MSELVERFKKSMGPLARGVEAAVALRLEARGARRQVERTCRRLIAEAGMVTRAARWEMWQDQLRWRFAETAAAQGDDSLRAGLIEVSNALSRVLDPTTGDEVSRGIVGLHGYAGRQVFAEVAAMLGAEEVPFPVARKMGLVGIAGEKRAVFPGVLTDEADRIQNPKSPYFSDGPITIGETRYQTRIYVPTRLAGTIILEQVCLEKGSEKGEERVRAILIVHPLKQ